MGEKPNDIHPIWKTVHVAVVMGIVLTFLKFTVTTWDDEIWGVLGILTALIVYAFGGDGAKMLAKKMGIGNGDSNCKK